MAAKKGQAICKTGENMKISELRPGRRNIELRFKVLSVGETKEVLSRLTGEKHDVAEAVVGDETGTVILTLWNEHISAIEVGKSYEINNGRTSLFQRHLRLGIAKDGQIEEIEDIGEVNEEVDASAREWNWERRKPMRFSKRRERGGGNRNRFNRD